MGRVDLSIIVNFHNMQREATRTLKTMSNFYQINSSLLSYEVIAIDNDSEYPLDPLWVKSLGAQFRYIRLNGYGQSPCKAINLAVKESIGNTVMICIDGARMLSPGILHLTHKAMCLSANSFVFTLSLHLGTKPQGESMLEGYCQAVEDRMLDQVDWQNDGYTLFDVASLAGSSRGGYFSPINESNCITVKRDKFLDIGGYEEGFLSPGGGIANLDFFDKLQCDEDFQPIMLLGEATFHQFHGGVASNVPAFSHPWKEMLLEYKSIRGKEYNPRYRSPIYVGSVNKCAKPFLTKTLL